MNSQKRGAGISQPLLHAFALKITDCEWVHIFPEGKIVQSGSLGSKYFGTRTKERALEIGKLKWGVGKLIGKYLKLKHYMRRNEEE